MPFDDLFNKIQAIEDFDVEKEAIEIIQENEEIITELLREQLSKGKDGNNEPVTIYGSQIYKNSTVWKKTFYGKDSLSREVGYITNYMSGTFYKSLFVITSGSDFEISSKTPYFDNIITRSGSVIMNLNSENLSWFSENILAPELQNRFTLLFNGI